MTDFWDDAPCTPVGESAYPPDVVGDDLSRFIEHPCIGWAPPAAACDLLNAEAAVRVMPVEAAAELYLWLDSLRQAEPLRTPKPGWEAQRRLIDALCWDLGHKRRLMGVLSGWEQETSQRRQARVQRAYEALDPVEVRREVARDMFDARDEPLPEPLGRVG